MLNEFLEIFTQMSTLAIILFVAGFSLMLLEIFISAFGVFMFVGFVSITGGIVVRAILGATFFQVIAMTIVFGIVALLLFYCYIRVLEGREASRNGYVNQNTSVSSNPYEEYGHLLGLVGTVISECKPYGRAKIDRNRYEVVSDDGTYISKNTDVEVVDVDFDHIFVKTIKD